MCWQTFRDMLVQDWEAYSTVGTVHVHAILVHFKGHPIHPRTKEDVIDAIDGSINPNSGRITLKKFYEDVSRQRLLIGSVTAEQITVPWNSDKDKAKDDTYEAFFNDALSVTPPFPKRTHFLFGFDGLGASGSHQGYRLNFDLKMNNESSIAHEFGHCLGMKHATVPSGTLATLKKDGRGDKSDRMGAEKGWSEFNAPNLIKMGWLEKAYIEEVTAGEHAIAPLEFSYSASGIKKVLMVPITDKDNIYLSMRDAIGPYDSVFLPPMYRRTLCIHAWAPAPDDTKTMKTQLLTVLGKGQRFPHNDKWFMTNSGEIRVEVLSHDGSHLKLRILRR